MDDLKTYIYISKSKIDPLFDQLIDQETTTTKELGLDIKLLKASLKSEVSKRDTLVSRLNAVVTHIRRDCNIGSVDNPSEYFEGRLRLKFGAAPKETDIKGGNHEMVIWGNEVAGTILGLSGSTWHLIGVKPAEQTGYGGSFTLTMYDHLTRAARDSDDSRHPPPSFLSERTFTDLMGRGLSRMLQDFYAEQNVEFLARKFDRFAFGDKWILLGSPLYVALAE
jgi:hypothetical protein